MNLLRNVRSLLRRGRLDAEMREEMRHHIEEQTRRNIQAGMDATEARFAAERAFGNVSSVQERVRERRGWLWWEQIVQDLRHALRSLMRTPGFTAVATLTLALGIGLVTVQFSLVNGALYHGLPFESSERLMMIERVTSQGRQRLTSLEDFQMWRGQQVSFGSIAAHSNTVVELSGEGLHARSYRGAAFSAGVLELLGSRPMLGRGFQPADEQSDAPRVVLLSQRVWESDFGGAPDIVGRTIRVRGEIATVIGVMPAGFAYPRNESAWINLRLPSRGSQRQQASAVAAVIGRLQEGTTLASARAEFGQLVARTEAAAEPDEGKRGRPLIQPMIEVLNSTDIQVVMYSLLGVVGGVLGLACLNVGNLLSARALQRGQELAVRSALGASRARIVRLMIGESLLLATGGAIGGLLLAVWAVPALDRGLAVNSRPFWVEIDLDYRVLAVTAAMTILIGVLAGLVPALRSTRRNAGEMLKEAGGGAGTISNARLGRMNRWLVVAQVGISCMVLTATVVLVEGTRQRTAVEQSSGADRMLSAQLRLRTPRLDGEAKRETFYRALLERLQVVPGVREAAVTADFPFSATGLPLEVRDRPALNGAPLPGGFVNAVSPGYFTATGLPVIAGREFGDRDRPESERVAVISESLARQIWPGESALGRQLRPHRAESTTIEPWLTVVGVVADLPVDGPDFRAGIHVPITQKPPSDAVVVLVAEVEPLALTKSLRDAVKELDEDVPVDRVFTLAGRIEDDLKLLVTLGRLASAFGLSALLLAAAGVYGVTFFAVQKRTREFGLRMALGARPGDVLRLVIRGGARQCALGLAGGGALGWAVSRPLENVLANVQAPVSGLIYLAVAGVIAATVLFALWLPALRAAKADPMVALRAE